MQKWEYLDLTLEHTRKRSDKIGGEKVDQIYQNEAALNALGEEGSELVGFTPIEFVLKRPKG